MPFIFFSCFTALNRTCRTMLIEITGVCNLLCSWSYRESNQSFTIKYDVSDMFFWRYSLSCLRNFSSSPSLKRGFFVFKYIPSVIDVGFCQMIFLHLMERSYNFSFLLMANFITWFVSVKPTVLFWDKLHLAYSKWMKTYSLACVPLAEFEEYVQDNNKGVVRLHHYLQ